MIKKEQCIIGTKVKINDKISRFNNGVGAKHNGLICMVFNKDGVLSFSGQEREVFPGVILTIQSKPKRFNGNGNQIKFTIEEDETLYSAWWICFKSKVDLV